LTDFEQSGLFAGALVTLAQLVVTESDGSERLPQALRWFSYSSVFLSFTSTFLCLTCVRMCSEIPGMAARFILDDPNCLPARVARGEPISAELMRNPHEMLRQFGGPKGYETVEKAFNFVFIFGCLCTFVSLVLWIFAAEVVYVAGSVMATVIPTIICVIWSFRPSIGFRARFREGFA